jgi:hypothetical protein
MRKGKGTGWGGSEENWSTLPIIYIWKHLIKPTKHWKGQGGGSRIKEIQSILHVYMELSEWNPLILLMYGNKNSLKRKVKKIKINPTPSQLHSSDLLYGKQ